MNHVYKKAGSFTVTLTVTDDYANSNGTSLSIAVQKGTKSTPSVRAVGHYVHAVFSRVLEEGIRDRVPCSQYLHREEEESVISYGFEFHKPLSET